jgi:peptidoglycan L-alanyl-D-glutamate endopeptidase CwlK
MILMALATIRAETAGFIPIGEFKSKYNTSPGGHPFDLYDNRADLGNKGKPDGASFKGRGFIQLTGRSNYKQHGTAIGLGNQLIENPELANEPTIAAKLLASFIKNKEQAIKVALLNNNLKEARRLVNGGSHGLTNFTNAFRAGEKLVPEL